jgi:hypothetical protein
MRFRLTSFFLAAAMLNALAQEGSASANIVSVNSEGGSAGSVAGNPSAHISFDWNSTNASIGILGHAEATAANGYVDALASASAEGVTAWHTYQGVGAHAASVYDDIIITAPGEVTVTSVNATAHFHVSGILNHGGNSGGGIAYAEVHIIVGDADGSGTLLLDGAGVSSTGIFAGSGGAPELGGDYGVTGNIPVGVATVLIRLDVSVEVGQNGAPPGIASFAGSDFFHTVSFATDRPVFDLPEGWTVNSVSANIVNNYWIPPAAVPEPASALLALIAAAGGAISVRRKRGPNSRSTNIVRSINSR